MILATSNYGLLAVFTNLSEVRINYQKRGILE